MSPTAAKVVYKPVGIASSIVGGVIAGMVFKQVWKRIEDEEDAPGALESEYPWGKILLAAGIQGAFSPWSRRASSAAVRSPSSAGSASGPATDARRRPPSAGSGRRVRGRPLHRSAAPPLWRR